MTAPLVFGKYKGLTPEYVASHDPGYVIWCDENIDTHPFPDKLVQECLDCVEDTERHNDYGPEFWSE